MDTRHLRYFLAVADAGSITGAADVLNISQPALTAGIRNLEIELDTRLFDRLPRGVRLTETGQALSRHARTVFTQMSDARSEIQMLKRVLRHEVTIGAGPMWLRAILPGVAAEMGHSHPEYQVIVRSGYEQALFGMLRSGEVEFALTEIGDGDEEPAFVHRVLSTDRYEVVCREGHPLVARQPVSLLDLRGYRWAMPDRAEYAMRRLSGLYLAENLKVPEIGLRSDSLRFLTAVVMQSEMLSFIVCTAGETRLDLGLVALRTTFELPSRGQASSAARVAGCRRGRGCWPTN
jgi:DNA-binding transcriptional LysR family regulator